MMVLPDNETKTDLLNNEAIARTVIELLQVRPDHPVTIGVHGDWGAGKSSVLEMIEAGLAGREGVLCLKFNGWRFQGFEDAKIALIEGIVNGLVERKSLFTKAADATKEIFRKIDYLKAGKRLGGLAFNFVTGLPSPDQIASITDAVTGFLADPAKLVTPENVSAVTDEVKNLIKPDSAQQNVPREIEEFRKAFDDLLAKAEIKQLVVLIDDLDRCLPDTAIETLEAVRLFMFTTRTAFVVAADEAMIEYAVRKHFPDLPDTSGPRDYARNYLEKLIQIPFRIPALGEAETRIYVKLLLVGAALGDDDADYKKLITAAREHLKQPWNIGVLDEATLLGTKINKASGAITLSDQIGPILAKGTHGNPRQIKRFLNSLLLRNLTAQARGFGTAVTLPVLAKLMLAERFIPTLFDQIALASANHPGGKCEALDTLEKNLGTVQPTIPPTQSKGAKAAIPTPEPVDSPVLASWFGNAEIKQWASIGEKLGAVDLRPYLFVTKDRKDYLGVASALGHLVPIVEKLMGTALVIRTMEGDLKKLKPEEALQIFEALKLRILGVDLKLEPAGRDGIALLVAAQPSLQANLLNLLDGLPTDQCGPWAISGWDAAITAPDMRTRFDGILGKWANSKSPMLKSAAVNVLKTKSR